MSTATEPHRGLKRPAAEALEAEQRLSKRFNLLNIDSSGKLYIPVAASSSTADSEPPLDPSSSRTAAAKSRDNDWMQLEDTKDKVYIYDLDEELAELESDEETPIFLPDIEKHLTKIPKHVLVSNGKELERTADNQLVLYGVPASLSVPEDKDSVRKAIIEARHRAEQKSTSLHESNGSTDVLLQQPGKHDLAGADDVMATDVNGLTDDMEVEPMEIE
ncbi:hypothetical protein DIS24_g5173 [Lasiodiplodia hormozganensis]|uniref:Uncharacterized protein n=1 Tax=Lasiodiplodia hormozganensis TaxID=869390 RepID=A0AA39YMJ6_9PEZI|nr:hypothetical protein DIS24_g5173 [Lasiodiplodia hormozganensis]